MIPLGKFIVALLIVLNSKGFTNQPNFNKVIWSNKLNGINDVHINNSFELNFKI